MKKKREIRGRKVMGLHCLQEILKFEPERIIEVYSSRPLEEEKQLCKRGIPVRKLSKQELFRMVKSESHQGVVALVHERGTVELEALLKKLSEKKRALVLFLDSIVDPHNVGALLRAAECFGCDAVIWSKNRGAALTPTVSKVSVGASELVPICKVSNLVEAISRFQKNGFTVFAAAVGEEAKSVYRTTFPEKSALVLGSEGAGVRSLIKKRVDGCIEIPMWGRIDSLNVSQACAVLLARARLEQEKV